MKTITEYAPMIFARLRERQQRREARVAWIERALNVLTTRLLLPCVGLLGVLVVVAIIGELLLALIHLLT